MSQPFSEARNEFRLYSIFTGIFVTALVLVAPLASKFIAVGPFTISGATLIFPITFIFNDILTEVYGYKRSRRIIWTGMACQILAVIAFKVVEIWPAADFWQNQAAYTTILGSAFRITMASIAAYFCSEFTNSVVLSKMKYAQHGVRGFTQAWRFTASTIAGELVDSVIFMLVAFLGIMPIGTMVSIILTIWVAKVLYEVILLPVSIPFANWVKRVEGVDTIDDPVRTSYNPFQV